MSGNGKASNGALASLREQVQARREALQASRTTVLDVPGYDGTLRARYRLLDWREIRAIGDRIAKLRDVDEFTRELYVAADTIVAACEATLDAEGNEFSPIGMKLAHDLGFDAENDRQAVFAIVARDTWVATHFADIQAWIEGETEATTAELAGESAPPTPSS